MDRDNNNNSKDDDDKTNNNNNHINIKKKKFVISLVLVSFLSIILLTTSLLSFTSNSGISSVIAQREPPPNSPSQLQAEQQQQQREQQTQRELPPMSPSQLQAGKQQQSLQSQQPSSQAQQPLSDSSVPSSQAQSDSIPRQSASTSAKQGAAAKAVKCIYGTQVTRTDQAYGFTASSLIGASSNFLNGGRNGATTLPDLLPRIEGEVTDNKGRISCFHVATIGATVKMPFWINVNSLCPPIQNEWSLFLLALETHEGEHVDAVKKYLNQWANDIIKKKMTREEAVSRWVELLDQFYVEQREIDSVGLHVYDNSQWPAIDNSPECKCSPTQQLGASQVCYGQCVDTNTDEDNCGMCGNFCSIGYTCTAGICTSPSCSSGGCACTPEDIEMGCIDSPDGCLCDL